MKNLFNKVYKTILESINEYDESVDRFIETIGKRLKNNNPPGRSTSNARDMFLRYSKLYNKYLEKGIDEREVAKRTIDKSYDLLLKAYEQQKTKKIFDETDGLGYVENKLLSFDLFYVTAIDDEKATILPLRDYEPRLDYGMKEEDFIRLRPGILNGFVKDRDEFTVKKGEVISMNVGMNVLRNIYEEYNERNKRSDIEEIFNGDDPLEERYSDFKEAIDKMGFDDETLYEKLRTNKKISDEYFKFLSKVSLDIFNKYKNELNYAFREKLNKVYGERYSQEDDMRYDKRAKEIRSFINGIDAMYKNPHNKKEL